MSNETLIERTAEFVANQVTTRGGPLPDILTAFPELGFTVDGCALSSPPCPKCGGVFVQAGFVVESDPYAILETRDTGSSLRLISKDPQSSLELGVPSTMSRWTIICGSGSVDCGWQMPARAVLNKALKKVGAEEFASRLRSILPGDFYPRDFDFYFLSRATDPSKSVVFSRGAVTSDALAKLQAGAGAKVLVQCVQGWSYEDAAAKVRPDGWQLRMTDKAGRLEGTKSYAKALADEEDRLDRERAEREITSEVRDFEARLRRAKLNAK